MMSDKKNKNLHYLHELSDYKVESHDPDVRGWKVKDAENRVVGTVDNLLVSKERKKVVYLDVEVDSSIIEANHDPYGKSASDGVHEFINRDGENHLIVPVGLVDLDKDNKCVVTDRIDHRTFAETKRMEKGYDVDREYEVVVLESYNRDSDRRDSLSDRDRNLTDRDRTTDRDRELTDRDKTRTDRDRDLTDRDRTTADRDRDLGERDRRNSDDGSFYDRGEFDSTRYRKNR